MTTYFLGGAAGSTLGAYGWSIDRWTGVCVIGVILLLGSLTAFLFTRRTATQHS